MSIHVFARILDSLRDRPSDITGEWISVITRTELGKVILNIISTLVWATGGDVHRALQDSDARKSEDSAYRETTSRFRVKNKKNALETLDKIVDVQFRPLLRFLLELFYLRDPRTNGPILLSKELWREQGVLFNELLPIMVHRELVEFMKKNPDLNPYTTFQSRTDTSKRTV